MLIGDKKQKEKRRIKRKKQETGPNPATLDPSVTSIDQQGLYGEPFFYPPWPTEDIYILLRSNISRQPPKVLYCWGRGAGEEEK